VQSSQTAPLLPHSVASVPATHVPAAQQPEHVAGPHWHVPPVHSCPLEHAAAAPHWHRPVAAQLSARAGSQPTQAAPAVPQCCAEGA
jgi:hypothetical protein